MNTAARQQVGGVRSHHRCRLAADRAERRRVEVVEVRVRHEHQIDVGQFVRRERALDQPQGSQRAHAQVHADPRDTGPGR